jgi:hypothetical protein
MKQINDRKTVSYVMGNIVILSISGIIIAALIAMAWLENPEPK